MGLGYEVLTSKPRTLQSQPPGGSNKLFEMGRGYYKASLLKVLTNGTQSSPPGGSNKWD